MKKTTTILSTALMLGIQSATVSIAQAEDAAPSGIETIIAADYQQVRQDVQQQRKKFHHDYVHAPSAAERQKILFQAQNYLINTITEELLPAWTGTYWAFSGTSEVPLQGTISCGYFVSTILEHAGFNVNRMELGQLHAGNIILNLNDNPERSRIYNNVETAVVEEDVQQWGKGIYIVGLDTHTGFIINDGEGTVTFVHSSYYKDKRVVAEPLQGNNPFQDSKYRVIGKLLDEHVTTKWLFDEHFPLTYTTPDDYKRVEKKILRK